jgi:hypothetical protein
VSALDDILAELAAIRDRLQETVDAAERAGLLDRREELRRRARDTAPVPRRDLEQELQRLVDAWDRLQRQRIDPIKQAGGGSSGGDFGFAADAVRLNQRIDAAAGREELERRIRELKVKLERLEDRATD